jgi:hypothetical protein
VDVETEVAELAESADLSSAPNSAAKEVTREASRHFRRRLRLLRQISIFEVTIYLLVAAGFSYRQMISSTDFPMLYSQRIFYAVTAPEVLFSFGLCFVSYFSLLLNGVTPIVSVISRARGPFDLYELPRITEADIGPSDATSPLTSSPQQSSSKISRQDTERSSIACDPLENDFATYIARSQDATRVAQRRPNALLFVGTIIAATGLIFFVLTLPGSRYGFLDAAPPTTPDLKADFWSSTPQPIVP